MSWENLCRFCGIEYEKELDLKKQSKEILLEVIQKLFNFNNSEMDLIRVCTSCNDFIVNLCNFYERAKNVENLLIKLKNPTMTPEISIELIDMNFKCESGESLIENIPSYIDDKKKSYKLNNNKIKTEIKENQELFILDNDNILNQENDNSTIDDNSTNSKNHNIKLKSQLSDTTTLSKFKSRIPITQAKYKCNICNMIFYRESNFIIHNKKIHNIVEEIEPCNTCGKKFPSKSTLRSHKKLHLSMEEKEKYYFKCPHCDMKYPKNVQMLNHIRSIHSKERPFICESCGKAYTSQNNLYSHRKEAHERMETACTICKKIFKTASRMRNHIKTHKEPSIPCTICGDFLKSKKNLKNHMLIHSDIKAYKCNYCEKEFKREITLQLHMLIHTDLKPFICRFCGQNYAHPSNCKKHEEQLHTYEYQNAVNKNHGINIPLRKFEKLPSIRQLHEMLEDLKNSRAINSII